MNNDQPSSRDSLFDGAVICRQNIEGYRFSLDAVLVAHFSYFKKGDTVLDLGCGCGIIGLILSYRWKHLLNNISGIELQPSLAALARGNIIENGYEEYINIVEGDLKKIGRYYKPEIFSKIICNPPFYQPSRGRRSVNQEAYIARHQVEATLDDIVTSARFCVKNKGSVAMVFPAEGMAELLFTLRSKHLEPKRIQVVYSHREDEKARLVLVEAVKNGGEGVIISQPFYIYQKKNGPYSEEMQNLYDAHPIHEY